MKEVQCYCCNKLTHYARVYYYYNKNNDEAQFFHDGSSKPKDVILMDVTYLDSKNEHV